ncbi:MAG: hypothetical protein EA352_02640, partial [Gemmatimonadales bacterium]
MGEPVHHLRLLSTAGIEDAEGRAVDLAVGKPFAVLAHLHLTGEAVARDELAELFWPRSRPDRGRASVRQALWALRKALGDELFAGDDPVRLRPGALVSDVEDVRDALSRGQVDAALQAWPGPPDDRARVADAPQWNQALDRLGEELEDGLRGALLERARSHRASGQPREAIRDLKGAVRVSPHRLRPRLELLDVLLDLRERSEAEAQLSKALDAIQDPEGREALEARRERLRSLGTQTPIPVPDGGPVRMEFTGRTEALARLAGLWQQTLEGRAGAALLTGPAGIGKTRLAREVVRVAQGTGGRTVVVKAEDSERPIEWGLLSELIQRLLRLSGAAGISNASDSVLRALVPSLNLVASGSEPGRPLASAGVLAGTRPSGALADALADLLTAVSEDSPLLVLVDDLHWADTESRAILTRVALRIREATVLLLFTSRPGTERSRARKTIRLLRESRAVASVELEPWTPSEVGDALDGVVRLEPGEDGDAIRQRIHHTTRGNPLFVAELLNVFRAEGILEAAPPDEDDARLRFRAGRLPPDFPLPDSLRALVDQQLDLLSDQAALVAAHLARLGRPSSPRTIAMRAGMTTSAVTSGIGELLQRGMVRWEGDESLTFLHDELRASVARRYQLHVGLTAGGGAQWSFFRTAVAASLFLLVLGAVAYLYARPAQEALPPVLGGGTILVAGNPGSAAFRMGTTPEGGLDLQVLPEPVVDSLTLRFAPSDPGDGVLRISDDGHHAILTRPSEDGYHQLVLHHRRTGGEREVVRTVRPPLTAGFSPGGQRLSLVLPGARDRLLVATPAGQVLASWPAPRILDSRWCGEEELLVLARMDGRVEGTIWNPAEGVEESLDLAGVALGRLADCSPDGRGVVFQGARGEEVGLFLLHRQTGQVEWLEGLPPTLAGAPTHLEWISDDVPPVPAAIRIAGSGTRVVGWGEQVPLDGDLLFSDGSTRPSELTWISRNPDVAFVSHDGRVTGTRPGESWIVAEWNGWLTDSIWVQVTP